MLLTNANIIDVYTGEVLNGNIKIDNGKIVFVDYNPDENAVLYSNINEKSEDRIIDLNGKFVSPTFIDAHIHIESSHIIPSEFEKYALLNGVSKVVIDPHEIANIVGIEGIEFMINDAKLLDVYCMIPSCVPATNLETNGATIASRDIEELFNSKYKDKILGLGEVMNYIGVINDDKEVLEKIDVAKKYNKLIDGHAPQLTGLDLNRYIEKGIMSDHECTDEEEALEKIRLGIKLMIREGTASKNINLLKIREKLKDIRNIMLVSDDISIKDLKNGYMINTLKKAVKYVSPIEAIQMVTINPANYFGFEVGIKPSNNADLIIFEDLQNFKIYKVMIRGKFLEDYDLFKKYGYHEETKSNKYGVKCNTMNYNYKSEKDFLIPNIDYTTDNTNNIDNINNTNNTNNTIDRDTSNPSTHNKNKSVRVILPIENSLITKEEIITIDEAKNKLNKNEINRIYIVERHRGTNNIGKGIIKFLKKGTIASTYAHDSHNVVVIGNDLRDITLAVNHLKDIGGGFVAIENGKILESVPLAIAGIMGYCGEQIYEKMESIGEITKHWSIFDNESYKDHNYHNYHNYHKDHEDSNNYKDHNLFLAMSFLSLSVIPELKITDKGLVKNNRIVDLIF